MDATTPDGIDDVVVLYSSRRSWAFAIVGALALVGGPIAVATTRSLGGLGIGALVVGIVATIALLVDQPIRSSFSPSGVDRNCPAVSRHINWDQIETLERLRRSGGVVAQVGRRRIVLCDRMEGHAEHLKLMEVIAQHAPNVIARLESPKLSARPTDLYRRNS